MAILFKTTGNLHPPASPPNPCLQVCVLICKSRDAFINPELSSQRLGFCHEERRERRHSWVALTRGWPKLLSHPECTTGIQRATKPRRGVSGCVTMSNCTVSSPLWLVSRTAFTQLGHGKPLGSAGDLPKGGTG